MKKIAVIGLLTVVCAAFLVLPDAHAKRDSRDFGYKNWAEFCRGSAAAAQSAGFDLTVGECVAANQSANPAMYFCQLQQLRNPWFEEIFGNLGQCFQVYNGLTGNR